MHLFSTISCGLYYKSFTIVIYDRNDNGLYYKTMIVANLTMIVAKLALARSITYDRSYTIIVLATVIMIVNYDRKTFIVQATVFNANV